MRYRIALCGFSEFEYRAMQFSFQHPAEPGATGYDIVDGLPDADFAVVDAESKPAVKGLVLSGRVAHAVFVGAAAPAGAGAHLQRPIDPIRILRTLDELIAHQRARMPATRPEPLVLRDLPTLEDIVAVPMAKDAISADWPPELVGGPTPPSTDAAPAAAPQTLAEDAA